MNKGLAVQSAKMQARSYSKAATSSGIVKSLLEKKKLHTTAEKKASVDQQMYRAEQRSPPPRKAKQFVKTLDTQHAGPKPAVPNTPKFSYEEFYHNELEKKHKDKSYRYFNNINRLAQEFPLAHTTTAE